MIVDTDELEGLRGRVALVDGGFDPLHQGHIGYFRAASEIGLPVLCNVSPDTWVARKHPVLLPQDDRAAVIDAIRWIDYVHVSTTSTADVLRLLQPRYYVKGADWRGRLPGEEQSMCASLGIEIRYLDTVTNSSSDLVERLLERVERSEQ